MPSVLLAQLPSIYLGHHDIGNHSTRMNSLQEASMDDTPYLHLVRVSVTIHLSFASVQNEVMSREVPSGLPDEGERFIAKCITPAKFMPVFTHTHIHIRAEANKEDSRRGPFKDKEKRCACGGIV